MIKLKVRNKELNKIYEAFKVTPNTIEEIINVLYTIKEVDSVERVGKNKSSIVIKFPYGNQCFKSGSSIVMAYKEDGGFMAINEYTRKRWEILESNEPIIERVGWAIKRLFVK